MTEIFALLCAGVLVFVDQITKMLIQNNFTVLQSRPIIDGVLHLTYIRNEGAVGGILADHPWVFQSITAVVIISGLVLLFMRKIKSKWLIWAVSLIISGGIGNMIDRLSLGYVIDFIDFRLINFYVFNVADSCVVIGCVMILIYFIADTYRDVTHRKSLPQPDGKSENSDE
jgi:signal peptidase II